MPLAQLRQQITVFVTEARFWCDMGQSEACDTSPSPSKQPATALTLESAVKVNKMNSGLSSTTCKVFMSHGKSILGRDTQGHAP